MSDAPPSSLTLCLRGDLLSIPLLGEAGVIGRSAETADVVVDSRLVSRRHATWRRLGPEAVEIQDLGSANGTFLDGERLGAAPVVARVGQRLDFGSAGALVLAAESPQGTTHMAGARGLRMVVRGDGSVDVEVRVGDSVQALLGGKRAELLFILARQQERDADLEPAERGWMERAAVLRRLYGKEPEGGNRFYKLLHDTRAALERFGFSLDFLEARGTRLRMREPEGGVVFEG